MHIGLLLLHNNLQGNYRNYNLYTILQTQLRLIQGSLGCYGTWDFMQAGLLFLHNYLQGNYHNYKYT
jgi:hypothetical protein